MSLLDLIRDPRGRPTSKEYRLLPVKHSNLATYLYRARFAASLTQTELARQAGLSRNTVMRLEQGRYGKPGPGFLTVVAYLRGCGIQLYTKEM